MAARGGRLSPPRARSRRQAHRRGALLMAGATLCWAMAGMLVRNLDLEDSWEITFWRSLFMTAFILGVLALRYRGATFQRIRAVGLPGFIAGALWALMYVCFILALGYTTVANVLVLASVTPFTSALLGCSPCSSLCSAPFSPGSWWGKARALWRWRAAQW
jgi:drug/metabolite transporter (DMT)-like permease